VRHRAGDHGHDTYHENMSVEKVDALLEGLKCMPGTAADDVPSRRPRTPRGLPRARRLRDARRVLREMEPQDVTKEVTASGLLATARARSRSPQVAVVHLNDDQPHYLCANADEGEPGPSRTAGSSSTTRTSCWSRC